MKPKQRFIITEIYQNDLHSADKVLVDSQTHVQYLLHTEGSGCSCTPLIDEHGKPLLCPNPIAHPDSFRKQASAANEKDHIQKRKDDEPLETIAPVSIKKVRKNNDNRN